MPVRIETVGGKIAPAPFLKPAQLDGPGFESATMGRRRILHPEIEFASRDSVGLCGIGQNIPEQSANPCRRHQSEDAAVGENELRHAGNVEIGRAVQSTTIERRARLLIPYIENDVGLYHTSVAVRKKMAGADCVCRTAYR